MSYNVKYKFLNEVLDINAKYKIYVLYGKKPIKNN